ncbi:MAG: AEC family transporter [Bacillota bacterium]|nr:AEC family transporter [Bacillota bacterium]
MLLEILLKILSIFLFVAMGLVAAKVNLLPRDAVKTLNGFVLNVAVPCLVLSSMQRDEITAGIFDDVIWSFAAFAIVTVIIAILAILIVKPIKSIKDEDKGIYSFQIVFTNAGFMGYPLTTILFGRYALFLAIVMNIVFTLLVYSLGVIILLHKKGEKILTMAILVRILTIPFVSSVIGLIIFITGLHFPVFINDTLELMAGTLSPVAMFVVGMNLSKSKIKSLFNLPSVLLCVISLLVVPAITLGIDLLLPVSNMVLVIHVFLMAMPSPALVAILCNRYNKNARLASEGIASTTLLSLGTLSLWAFWLTQVFL